MRRLVAFVECEDGFEVSFQHYPDPDEDTAAKMVSRARGDFEDRFETHLPFTVRVEEAVDTCLLRTEGSGENCPPGHDCAECEHYETGEV